MLIDDIALRTGHTRSHAATAKSEMKSRKRVIVPWDEWLKHQRMNIRIGINYTLPLWLD